MDELVVGDYYYVSSISEDHARKLRELKYASRPRKCTSLRGKFKLEKDCYRYMKYWVKENEGMKIEDIKVGMKVVPHSKTAGSGSLSTSPVWRHCREKHQPYMIALEIREDGRITCDEYESDYGDFFDVSDLTPYEEKYTCNIPGVTAEFTPGKEYWVDDYCEIDAVGDKHVAKYVCTINGEHYFNINESLQRWKIAVDPDTYKEPETEMTIEEVAEALRKSGAITGKLKIKE